MEERKTPNKALIFTCIFICIGLVAYITLRFIIPIANGTIAEPDAGKVYTREDVDEKIINFLNNEDKRYAYTQLNANEKEAYERLKWGILSFAERIDIKAEKLTVEDLRKVYSALRNDYPEIFWTFNNCNIYNTGKYITDCLPEYVHDKEKILTMVDSIEAVKNMLLEAVKGKSDYEKSMFMFEYLIDYTDYDTESYEKYANNEADDKLELSCGIYGTLLSQKALCEGYAKTYKYLLEAAGVECIYVTGVAQGEGHAWNLVKLDGNYYAVDVTWCDPKMSSGSKSYAYCMVDDSIILTNHEIQMDYKVPACTATKYNYYVKNGFELYAYDTNTLQDMFYRAYINNQSFVEFHCKSKTVLDSFKLAVESGDVFKCFAKIENATGKRYTSFNYGLMEDVCSVRVNLTDK